VNTGALHNVRSAKITVTGNTNTGVQLLDTRVPGCVTRVRYPGTPTLIDPTTTTGPQWSLKTVAQSSTVEGMPPVVQRKASEGEGACETRVAASYLHPPPPQQGFLAAAPATAAQKQVAFGTSSAYFEALANASSAS